MLRKILLRLFISLAFIYIALCSWLYFSQRSLLYFPAPAAANVQAQTFELQSDGLVLKGWIVNPGKSRAVIYFGGNGESVENNVEDFQRAFPDQSIYLLPYRGYGGNPGEVTEQNLYRDALNLYAHVKNRHQQVSVIGRSLGTGIAAYLASKRKLDKLVLVTPYDSIMTMAQAKYPAFPVGLMMKDRFESWRWAADINSDVLVMIAGSDEVIPLANTENLIRHFKRKPAVIVFDSAGHNSISATEKYYQAIAGFIE